MLNLVVFNLYKIMKVYIHNLLFIYSDFACRNCVVMSNMTVKIGDYGVAEDHFRVSIYNGKLTTSSCVILRYSLEIKL